MTEQLYGTYRAGPTAPRSFGLQEGELYVEFAPAGGGNARLWVGLPAEAGAAGNVALLVGGPTTPPAPSTIAVDPVDNPSYQSAVHFTGTVEPGVEVEIAALQGLNPEDLIQMTDWSPWDATDGTFDVTWWLPAGDNVRIRVRMQDQPQTFADSNLFSVEPDPDVQA